MIFDEPTKTEVTWLLDSDDDFQLTGELLRRPRKRVSASLLGSASFNFTKSYGEGRRLEGVFAEMQKMLKGNPVDRSEVIINVPTPIHSARDLLEYEGVS